MAVPNVLQTYRVNWSFRDGTCSLSEHQLIDLDDETATHVNTSSPGVLTLVTTTTPAEIEVDAPETRDVQDAPNRMMGSAPKRRGRPPRATVGA